MKIIITPKTKTSQIVYLGMLSLAGVLILLLIIGTIIGVVRSSGAKPLFRFGKYSGTSAQTPASGEDIRVFSGLGQLRIPLANSSTLILSIAFPYPAHDTAFTEELAAKIGDFRSLAAGYFSALPPDKIANLDESAAKQEILSRYNAALRLGRINALYFSDMMIIDANLQQ
ncbi:MAG: flagellar basal body protein FliL [Treponema sp.]|nr:flagellar basal body protein FliL [Treponema sp.]